jgi:hypothetical protein
MKKKQNNIIKIPEMLNAEIKNISEWEVMTPTGFQSFMGIKKITLNKYIQLKIKRQDNTIIVFNCSENHKIKLKCGRFKYAKQLKTGDILYYGKNKIIDNKLINTEIDLYDLLDVENGNEFITEKNIVSHNCAFIQDIDTIWTSAQQTLATGGRAILLSTPNGVGNFFHKQWQQAEAKKNKFHTIRLPWTVHPERNQKWRDEQDELLGKKMAAQECDTCFESSGNTFVEMDLISFYEQTFMKDPIEMRYYDKGLWIWEYANYQKQYLICADVARGDGEDYSAFHVIDIAAMRQVAEYVGQIGTTEYGNLMVNVATEYNNALLVIENANVGWAAIQPAIDRQYPNLYYSYKNADLADAQSYVNKGYDLKLQEDMVAGFTTSMKTRPLILSRMELLFRNQSIIIHSKRLIEELKVFIWLNNKPQAQRGYNDDTVMSFAIGCWVRDVALQLRQQGIDLTKKSLDTMGSSAHYYGAVSSAPSAPTNNPFQQKYGNHTEDFSWLV